MAARKDEGFAATRRFGHAGLHCYSRELAHIESKNRALPHQYLGTPNRQLTARLSDVVGRLVNRRKAHLEALAKSTTAVLGTAA